MNNRKNDSLIEIAINEMEKKRSAKTISKIAKDVFEVKGIDSEEAALLYPQFEMDFMLSGHFICCGEDLKTGEKFWDLKKRKPSSLIDKEGNSLDDPYDDDVDVLMAELTDEPQLDYGYLDESDDEDDDEEEVDDIAEELEAFVEVDDRIKCPHCGELISPESEICPSCNFPIE